MCYCPESYVGNPFRACEQPIVVPELCAPGPCGQNADCYVVNGQEQCFCRTGYVGDAYVGCNEPPKSACDSNICGPRAQCIILPSGHTACQCPDGMGGDPSSPIGCHGYECRVDEECSDDKACIGLRCRDPCPGTCSVTAHCRVIEHHPVCSCPSGLTGNPLQLCHQVDEPVRNPCYPSPCNGINTVCIAQGDHALCRCIEGYTGSPELGCKPECQINSDCDTSKACINHKCKNPCDESICGINAQCRVFDHTAHCECKPGYIGNALYQCMLAPIGTNTSDTPCRTHPCGQEFGCVDYGSHVAVCDPCSLPNSEYDIRCRPECLINADCPFDKACIGQKCISPCDGACGHNALCSVYFHEPQCRCPEGLFGNPYVSCNLPGPMVDEPVSCGENTCGINTECRKRGNALSCVCLKGFKGDPLVSCRPECVINSECPMTKACFDYKCINPCENACGRDALCQVINHFPVCYCPPKTSGDPLVSCSPVRDVPYIPESNPCDPSPCGAGSRCLVSPEGHAICSCLPSYRGAPPACQRECIASSECPLNRACINFACVDPCIGQCSPGARCQVIQHNAICACPPGTYGDPFKACFEQKEPPLQPKQPENPCIPSPCGPLSICQVKQGRPVCSCQANYIGQPPYCRPECVIHSDCPHDKACINERCQNPCENNPCGSNAECFVVAHSASCYCIEGYQGDAFVGCSRIPSDPIVPKDPCYPSPCSQNAKCSSPDGIAYKCSCIPPYIGDPYNTGCRPECTLNSDCPSHLACINQHCRDACPGICGPHAICTVNNNIPNCACEPGYVGDAFAGCRLKPIEKPKPVNPCQPSPCGPNSQCRNVGNRATCSCIPDMLGSPPNCRPECVVNAECSLNQACVNKKCVDPCKGETCGIHARCETKSHNPICSCPPDFPIGDPFDRCVERRKCNLSCLKYCYCYCFTYFTVIMVHE